MGLPVLALGIRIHNTTRTGSEYYDKLGVNTETQAVMNVTFLTAPAVSYLAGILF